MDFTSIRKAALCATILMAAVLGAAPLWAQLTAGERHVLAPPAARSPEYGAEVALDGRFAAVGDPAGDAVHLFVHEPSSRSVAFSATLRPQDRWDGRFGTALAMAGGRLFVGAPEPTRDLDGQDDWRGDVVVFRESSGSWVRERVLRGSAPPSVTVDGFGSSLAANERHVLVAARDERALYAFDAVTGVAALQRIDVNARAPSAQAWDQLAGLMSLLLDGDSAVVGLKYDDYTAFHALRWNGARWEWEAEILRDELPESAYGGGASFRAGRLLIPTLRGVRHFERTPSGQWVERAVVASAAAFAGDGDLRRVSLAAAGAFVLELSALKFYSPNAGTWQVGGSIEAAPPIGTPERRSFARGLSASGNAVLVGSPGNREPALLLGPPGDVTATNLEITGPAFAAGVATIGQSVVVSVRMRSLQPMQDLPVQILEGAALRCTAVLRADGTGSCNARFSNAGRVGLEARFEGVAGMAPASARRDVLIQPPLGFPVFGSDVALQVGVPVRGQLSVSAVGATPPFRFTPTTLVSGVSLDAEGRISGTPTGIDSGRSVAIAVSDSSASIHGLDFRWTSAVRVSVGSGATPRISVSSPTVEAIDVGAPRVLPVVVIGPSDSRFNAQSLTPDICRVDASAQLVVEGLRLGLCRLAYEVVGTGYLPASGQWDIAVSLGGRPLLFARPDRTVLARPPSNVVPAGEPTNALIDVLGNDLFDPRDVALPAGLTIVRAPSTGSVEVNGNGTLTYVPRTAFTAIQDSFRYRLCNRAGTACSESDVRIVARPGVPPGITLQVEGQSGSQIVDFKPFSTVGPIERKVGDLVAPTHLNVTVAPSAGVDSPFDEQGGGTRVEFRTVPANSSSIASSWRVHADAAVVGGASVALYLGLDSNRNGRADENEVACASTGGSALEGCDAYFSRQVGQGAQTYWVLVHNRGASTAGVRLEIFESEAVVARSPRVTVIGPATAPSFVRPWPTRIAWNDPTMLVGDRRLVDVSFWREGVYLGDAPVRIERVAGRATPIALRDGIDHPFALSPGERAGRTYFDVPRSASALRIDLTHAEGVSLAVIRAPVQSENDPSEAPSAPVVASIPAAGATKAISLTPSQVPPGRWYLAATNHGATAAIPTLRVTTTGGVERVEPVPGHYFNPQRSGHGAFLDYAGGSWVLIWYTYREDGSSVWYMTDIGDRSATSWTAPLIEFGWHRGKRVSSIVGWASVNALDGTSFAFGYTLHGRSGYERFERLGGPGCLSSASGAPPFDVSGLWFAPELSGYGWSVQIDRGTRQAIMASYFYDDLGRPLWVWSQEPIGQLGSSIDLTTARLDGPCPWCAYRPTTARADTGSVSVMHDGVKIQRMRLEHSGKVPGMPHLVQWSWLDPSARSVSQLSQPSGCR
jgi:hypothetical protein